jgi:hypothetical protein
MIGVQHWPLWLSLAAVTVLAIAFGITLVAHQWRANSGAKNEIPDPR